MLSGNYLKLMVLLISIIFISGCVTGKYKPAPDLVDLEVSFADSRWTGKRIPLDQHCRRFGGHGSTPGLIIKNIPSDTNAIIMEYSDRSHAPMNNGGHGKIGYRIFPGTAKIIVPSVPGHTFDLPKGFFLVKAHRNPSWDKAGAYMPPCSGGEGNYYYVTVKAVFNAPESEESVLLGKAKLDIGSY